MLQTEVSAEPEQGDTEAVLRSAVTHFSEAPLRNGKIMRDLVMNNYQDFRAAAVSVMRESTDVRGCRYLVTVLWTNDLLIPILGDCSLPKQLCQSIAQSAAKVDPQLHIRLIRYLESGMLEGKELAESSASRLLEVLGSIADGPGIHRFIRQMLQHPSARIRSKVTLLVERGGPGIRALISLLEDGAEDARVRANALESLWSLDDPEIAGVFRKSLTDPNNRVAGNAILGLYLTGDPQSIPALFDMAARDDTAAQITAVWAMGRTKDPRFLPCVGRFLLTSEGMLRKTAFKAVESIKKAAAERAKEPRFQVNILGLEEMEAGSLRLRLSLTYPSSAKPVAVQPTAFALHLDSQQVISFTCTEHQNLLLCVAFVTPRRAVGDPLNVTVDAAMRLCLDSKSRVEQWCVARYQETGKLFGEIQTARLFGQSMDPVRPAATQKPKGINFNSNSLALRGALDSSASAGEMASDALETMRAVFSATVPSRAVRHLIIVSDAGLKLGEEAATQLIADSKAANFAISALCISSNQHLARACAETAGTFRLVANAEAMSSEIPLVYASIRSQYVLQFPNTCAAGLPSRVSLSVNAEACTGETVWEPPQESLSTSETTHTPEL